MPRYRRRYSDDDDDGEDYCSDRSKRSKSRDKKLNIGLKVLNLFQPRTRRVVREVVEEPVRRRRKEHITERSESPEPEPLLPRRRRSMSPRTGGDRIVPLPPKIPKEPRPPPPQYVRSSREYHPDYDVEERVPRIRRDPDLIRRQPFEEPRPEVIEIRPSGAREENIEKAKRRSLEAKLKREKQARRTAEIVSDRNHDEARTYRETLDAIADRVRRVQLEKVRTEQELARTEQELAITQRERDVLERDRRLEAETRAETRGGILGGNMVAPLARGPPRGPPRPVDLFQEPMPQNPGLDAIRQAQEDERRRQQEHRQQDESLYHHRRETHPDTGGRRGSDIGYDDSDGRRPYRRR